MQQNLNGQRYIEEDEIDLRELFKTIWKNKKFIVIFTMIVTVLSIIYVLIKTPVYEAKAIVKIGEYKVASNSNSNSNIILDNASKLSTELNILFIDILKNEKDRKSWIEKISVLKKQKDFISITSQGLSNELAIKELHKTVVYIQNKHQKILDDVKSKREIGIKNINKKIDKIKTREIPTLVKKISQYKKDINFYSSNLNKLALKMNKVENETPALAMLELNEQRRLTEMVFKLRQDLINTKDGKFTLETETLGNLKEQIEDIQTLLKPYNYKNSKVVGKIMTNEYPVKPKKKLIVVVAFVTGFILSIFLVFFIEFIKNGKDEEKTKSSN